MGKLLSSYNLAGIAVLTLLTNAVRAEAQERVDQPSIHVRIYNMAQIPKSKLTNARTVAENVLHRAGVQVFWQECTPKKEAEGLSLDCDSIVQHTDIVVNLIFNLERLAPTLHRNALGCSIIPESGAPPTISYVDYSRVRRLAGSVSFDAQDLLGFAIVHEIGHLLLGNNSHSFSGIMRSPWRTRALQGRYWEEFFFTSEQVEQMRVAVLARNQLKTRSDAPLMAEHVRTGSVSESRRGP